MYGLDRLGCDCVAQDSGEEKALIRRSADRGDMAALCGRCVWCDGLQPRNLDPTTSLCSDSVSSSEESRRLLFDDGELGYSAGADLLGFEPVDGAFGDSLESAL
jgi:hypothetical protein